MPAPLTTELPVPPNTYRQVRKNQRAVQAKLQAKIVALDEQILECTDPEKILNLHGTRTLLENMYGWDDFGGSDVWYELRGQDGTDAQRWIPPSVPSDRRHGTNWPIWRWDQELDRLRNYSRVLSRQNAYAKGLLRNMTNYVIGKGFAYKAAAKTGADYKHTEETATALIASAQAVLDDFLRKNHWNGLCDPAEEVAKSTGTREREAYRRTHRDGEALIRLFFLDDGETQARFMEPEQLRNPARGPDEEPGDAAHGWSFGIRHKMEPNEDTESPEWYHFVYQDSSATRKKGAETGEFVPAREIVHVKNPDDDMATKRGLPSFVFETAQAFTRASKIQRNTSIAAAVRAATAEIWKHNYGTQQQLSQLAAGNQAGTITDPASQKTTLQERVIPGMIRRVPFGQEPVMPPNNNAVSEHLAAAQGDLRQGAAGFCAPEYLASSDASNANYSSTQEAGTPWVNNAESEQEHFKGAFLICAWKALRWAIEAGRLPAQVLEVVDIQVEAPKVKRTDELQKAQKDQILVGLGSKSPQTVAMEDGLDPDIEMANLEEHRERMAPPGQPLPMPGAGDDLPGPEPAPQLESLLFESFTGTVTDKLGRKIHYVDGKRVKGTKDGPKTDKPAAQEKTLKPEHAAKAADAIDEATLRHGGAGGFSGDGLGDVVDAYKGLKHDMPNVTTGEFRDLMKHLYASGAIEGHVINEIGKLSPLHRELDFAQDKERKEGYVAFFVKDQDKLKSETHKFLAGAGGVPPVKKPDEPPPTEKRKPPAKPAEKPKPAPAAASETPKHLVEHADVAVPKTLEKAKGLTGKLKGALNAIKGGAVSMYKKLEAKHGRGAAIAILAAGHAIGLATPLAIIPGSTFLGTAAVAYAYDAAKKVAQGAAGLVRTREAAEGEGEGDMGHDEMLALAHQVLAELVAAARKELDHAGA